MDKNTTSTFYVPPIKSTYDPVYDIYHVAFNLSGINKLEIVTPYISNLSSFSEEEIQKECADAHRKRKTIATKSFVACTEKEAVEALLENYIDQYYDKENEHGT